MILAIAVVTVQGANSSPVLDLLNANTVWFQECGVFVDVVSQTQINAPQLLVLSQADCSSVNHVVSTEEDALFDFGRGTGADVVVYYIQADVAGFAGCAAHPPGRRGCWVGDAASPWTFGHELGHIVGDNRHVDDSDNLMSTPTANIGNLPPDLTVAQCERILADPALLDIGSIVLNL